MFGKVFIAFQKCDFSFSIKEVVDVMTKVSNKLFDVVKQRSISTWLQAQFLFERHLALEDVVDAIDLQCCHNYHVSIVITCHVRHRHHLSRELFSF